MSGNQSPKEVRRLLASRNMEHVVVLGANGTMGYGSAALFTQAVPKVTFLARTHAKAEEGIAAAVKQVRAPTVANRSGPSVANKRTEPAVARGDREAVLSWAIVRLRELFGPLRVAPLYRTAPVSPIPQAYFFNTVTLTYLPPDDVPDPREILMQISRGHERCVGSARLPRVDHRAVAGGFV